jgi:hypothetical protein
MTFDTVTQRDDTTTLRECPAKKTLHVRFFPTCSVIIPQDLFTGAPDLMRRAGREMDPAA